MKMIKTILLLAVVFYPTISLAHDYQDNRSQRSERWWPNDVQEPYSEYYEYDRYDSRHPRQDSPEYQRNKQHKSRKQVKSGWDIDPRIAKQAPNCYRYTLSSQGGKGSARITPMPGENYIQVDGKKSGYVCFQGDPTLELGKLGNPNIKVKFKLEGRGSYGFGRGKKGSKLKNNWYRSYWGL